MILKAEILAIGDELLDGQGLDTNSRWLAEQLALLGCPVQRFTVVRDDEAALKAAILEACSRAGVVIATGGLGPTEDDRTRQAAAAAAGTGLEFHEASWQHIQAMFQRRGRQLHESNRRQAFLPASAEVIENRWGSAPGFSLPIGKATFHALPGVSREMRRMFETGVRDSLRQQTHGDARPLHFHDLYVLGCSEAALGERIAGFMDGHGDTRVGITASWGLLTVRIAAAAEAAARATAAAIRTKLGTLLVCEGRNGLAFRVGRELIDHDITCAVAESCTGGLLAASLTEVPGISSVFLAGMVTYSNEAKVRDLGVARGLVDKHGAVSVEVAEAMARGVVARTGACLGMAITGIAGPTGGTEEKPVGTVCFGLALGGEVRSHECRFGSLGREFIRRRSVWEALAAMHRGLAVLEEDQAEPGENRGPPFPSPRVLD